MAERLPRLVPGTLTDEQSALYDRITRGPRAVGEQQFALIDDDGALNGPFGPMLQAPAVGTALQELGSAIRYRTGLSDRAREIAILQVAAATSSAFEWHAHERVGRAAGLTDAELRSLREGTFRPLEPAEQAVATLTAHLLRDGHVDDDAFADTSDVLDPAAITEIVVLVGYYRTLAQLMDVFGIGAPDESAAGSNAGEA
jgi:4-carboxymuconolactone decarboxylase